MTTTHSHQPHKNPKAPDRTIDRVSLLIFVIMVAVLVYGLVAVVVKGTDPLALIPAALAALFAGIYLRK